MLFAATGLPDEVRRTLSRAVRGIRARTHRGWAPRPADIRVLAPRQTLERFTVAELERLQRLVRRTLWLRSVQLTVDDAVAAGGKVRVEVLAARGTRGSGSPPPAARGRWKLGRPHRGRFRGAAAPRPAAGPLPFAGAASGPVPPGAPARAGRRRPHPGNRPASPVAGTPGPAGTRVGTPGAVRWPASDGVVVSDRETLLVRRTLRSGQRVRFAGNVVVMGDVNPGAEVVAGGDVLVMGWLRGVAHAGASGDSDAVICAFRMNPSQLRIGGLVARAPDGDLKRGPGPEPGPLERGPRPELARVEDGVVTLVPYHSGRP